mmetsp:Transcript_14136/g.18370  ORF Transcript_14136/g.18370 Transcript_14136/m.18370 type:complete len:217 (+) Transcript_14136:63-713(+)
MGNIFKKPEMKILILGFDSAGKTTILYKLHLGGDVVVVPTIGINVETINFKNITLTCWDVGGRDKGRTLWRHYYKETNAIIWVIDSNDRDRIEATKDELHRILAEDELRDIPILIFCNKQDLPNAMTSIEISEALELSQSRCRWFLQPCCATTGDGLFEGLDWLSNSVSKTPSTLKTKEDDLKFPSQSKHPIHSKLENSQKKTIGFQFLEMLKTIF